MRGLARLQIDRMPGALRYRLEVPDRDGTSLEEMEHVVSDEALAEALGQADVLLRQPEVAGFGEHAALVGQRLYRNLVPSRLCEKFDALRLPILLLTNLRDFPFELFHDGREFFGLRFAVGRRVYVRREDRSGTQPRSPEGRRLEVLVIGSNPRGDLAFAQSEAEAVHARLSESLGETADLTLLLASPVAGQAACDDVADRLASGVDILHYCGHVERRQDGSVGLLLADERLLSVDDIANNLPGAPVVFLNGCASTRRNEGGASGSGEDLASVAGGFIRGGARAVIGTLSDVSDRCAAVLAEEFYRLTTAGVSLGEGLRRARAQCREKNPNSPTWLSFMLYGNPTQLFPNRHGVTPGSLDGQSRLAVFMSVEMVGTPHGPGVPSPGAAHRTAVFERAFREALADVPGADVLSAIGSQITARFATASSAVGAAFRFQQLLARDGQDTDALQARIGIDLREVSEFDPDGHGILKVVGMPAEVAEKLRKLALPGQILLSRSAFDGARWHHVRPITTSVTSEDAPVQWLAHGQYFLEGSEDPIDLFEVGISGRAPLAAPPDSSVGRRRLEIDEIAGWRPAVGAPIPRRDAWILERRLGEGGFGEVWLARHERLREARVFKFCFDKVRLRSFRQETRIFRLLRGALGARPDIARLYDVELERPPYFLESEYVPHGNLSQWAEGKGGIAGVPLDMRLEIFVQTATALSAAHSAGVLHKDLKPSNILIREDATGSPSPCLADFGIGAVADPGRLLDLGITPTAFATTAGHDDDLGRVGTRLYAPPESQIGGVPTEKGDIYALGVLLFQLVVGDFDRPLASGWERLIDDELLRADIGTMVEGDPAARLGSAANAAELVRQLPRRRAELRERNRAARRRRLLVRTGAALVVAALGLGVVLRANKLRKAEELKAYHETIHNSLTQLNDGKNDEARATLQAAPPYLRHWEWNYLWHSVNRIVYEGDPYRAVVLPDGRLRVDTGGDDARIWTGSTGLPLLADDTLCLAWLSPGGKRIVSVPRATNGVPRYDLWDRVTGTRLGGGALRILPSQSRSTDEPALRNGCPPIVQVMSNDDVSHFVIGGSVAPFVIDADQGAPRGEVATPEDRAALRSLGFAMGPEGDVSRRSRIPGIPVVSATSPDQTLVATIGETRDTLALRDLTLGRETFQVKVPSGAIKIEFSPRGDSILGLSWDQLWLWRVGQPAIDFVSRLGNPNVTPLRSPPVSFLGFNHDGTQAVAISERFRIFDTSGIDRRHPVRSSHLLHQLSPSGRFGLDPRRDHAAVVDLWSGKDIVAVAREVSGSAWSRWWFGEADTIVRLSKAGRVSAIDVATGREAWSFDLGNGGTEASEQADFAANRIAVSAGNTVRVVDLTSKREVATLPTNGRAAGFQLSPDGLRIVVHVAAEDEGDDGPADTRVIERMDLWNLETKTRVAGYSCGSNMGFGASFSPDGRWLLTNCALPTADIWDARTGASIRRLSGFDGGIYSAEFSYDGEHVVTIGQWDDKVLLWKVRSSGQPTVLSSGQTKWSHASFSPDGRRVVGARGDGTVTLWAVGTGKSLLTLGEPYQDDINRLAFAYFTAEGTRIVFLCDDVTRIWGY
jgi:serine/threonine protein kinase/WD40 repeat protein/class 3 adenylate cyclase